MLDDAYLNGYAKHLGTTASMVYIALCRCADREQKAFPSQETIADNLGINPRVVMRKIKILEEWNLINKSKSRNKTGKWLHNTYFLLDKSEWKQPPTQKVYMDKNIQPPTQKVPKPPTQKVHIKETHMKDTHIKEIYKEKKFSSVDKIQESDLIEISEKYKVSLGFVKLKLEVLRNYCESKGRRYKNYKSALRNFVLGDIQKNIERRSNDKYRAIDARNIK